MVEEDGDRAPPSWVKFVADFLRELAVLVFVFGILDGLLENKVPLPWPAWFAIVALVSFSSLAAGIIIEVRRR